MKPGFHETLAVGISLVLVLGYYLFLFRRGRRSIDGTIHALNARARLLWVRHVMGNEAKDLMAVQTLRNMVMAATFKATSSLVLIVGTLSLVGEAEVRAKAWHVLSIAGAQGGEWWLVKLLCLLLVLLVAFFAFVMVIRQLNHVMFMVSLPKAAAHGVFAPDQVAQHLNQAGVYYTVGMRAFFVTVPLAFWLFGPWFLVAATLGLIGVLYSIDRVPLHGANADGSAAR
jgi:uncharacterized membrane protein